MAENEIEVLVDVRTYPSSKYNPQFNQVTLKDALTSAGIRYVYRGKNLGGLGKNIDWDEAIAELYQKSDNMKVCVMCSEADANACHRKQTIQPAFEALGGKVEHILWALPKDKVETKKVNGNLSLF